MTNKQEPMISQIPLNCFKLPYGPEDPLQLNTLRTQFPLQLSIDNAFLSPQNVPYSTMPVFVSEPYLYRDQSFFIPKIYILPQQQIQLNALNQYMLYQNILNDNKYINNKIPLSQPINNNLSNLDENKIANISNVGNIEINLNK